MPGKQTFRGRFFMFKQPSLSKPVIFLALFLAVMFIAGQADAQTKVSGKMTMAYTKLDSLIIADTEGHNMALGESKGTNASTGDKAFMDGAETAIFSYADLAMGNGPQMGYTSFKMGDDMFIAKWSGEVKATMTEEGAPKITFSGMYKYIKGTGQYENIKGSGTYTGHFTSKTEFVVDWEGEYSLK